MIFISHGESIKDIEVEGKHIGIRLLLISASPNCSELAWIFLLSKPQLVIIQIPPLFCTAKRYDGSIEGMVPPYAPEALLFFVMLSTLGCTLRQGQVPVL